MPDHRVFGQPVVPVDQRQEGNGVPTVDAGKNTGKNVYVGVEQDVSGASTGAIAEVNITHGLKLRSTTTAQGSNRVGLLWEWDY